MAVFEGKSALVTGGSRGIGREIALRLADLGAAKVAISYLRADSAATVEDLIGRMADLARRRQSLRAMHSDHLSLEQNRCELVTAHWDLSRALIARHCRPGADTEAAAA